MLICYVCKMKISIFIYRVILKINNILHVFTVPQLLPKTETVSNNINSIKRKDEESNDPSCSESLKKHKITHSEIAEVGMYTNIKLLLYFLLIHFFISTLINQY